MPWPPDADLLAALDALKAEPLAMFGQFASLVLDPLIDDLEVRYPTADEADISDAATEALYAFSLHPERYDPTRLPLPRFLLLIARRRLSNILTAGRRHREGRIPWDSVELHLAGGNDGGEAETAYDDPAVQAALAKLTPQERQVLDLDLGGERRNEAFAELLGFTHLPVDEQRRQVKRVKDRIKARLRRAGGKDDD